MSKQTRKHVSTSNLGTPKRPQSYLAMFNDDCDRLHSMHSFQFAVALEQQLNKLDDILARHQPRGGDAAQSKQEQRGSEKAALSASAGGKQQSLIDGRKSMPIRRINETRPSTTAVSIKPVCRDSAYSREPLSRRPIMSRGVDPLNLSIPALAPARRASLGSSPVNHSSSRSVSLRIKTNPQLSRCDGGEEPVADEASRVAALREAAYQLEREIIMLETRRAVLSDEIQILSLSQTPSSLRSPPVEKLVDTFTGS